MLSELRQRYVLAYEPTAVPGLDEHRIEVELRGTQGDVRARRSHYSAR